MSAHLALDIRRNQRAHLPAPLVTIRAIEKLLLRHVIAPPTGHSPEQRLLVAVICQSIADLRCGNTSERQAARRFLLGNALNAWAQLLDLQASFIREVATKTHYLLPQVETSDSGNEPSIDFLERGRDVGFQCHST